MTGDARRWHLTEAPILAPAADYFTRSTVGPFVDMHTEVNFGMKGHVYISVETIRELAEIAGIIGEQKTPEEMNLYEHAIYNRGLKEGIARGEDIREQLSGLLGHLGPADPADDRTAGDGDAGDAPADPPAPAGEADAGSPPVGDPPKRRARGKARDAAGGEGADGVSGDGRDDDSAFRI